MAEDHVAGEQVSEVVGLYRQLDELLDRISAVGTTSASYAEIVGVAQAHERAVRRLGFVGLQRLVDCDERGVVALEGFARFTDFLVSRLRITDAGVRRRQIAALLPTYSLAGEQVPTRYPHVAQAWSDGAIGTAHVSAVLAVLDK
ncbi:HNH endonuclease, partial [Gordonia sp. CPCC 206044]